MEKPIKVNMHGSDDLPQLQQEYLELVTGGMMCFGFKNLTVEKKPVLGTDLIDFDIHVK